jgi:hypothetical protein
MKKSRPVVKAARSKSEVVFGLAAFIFVAALIVATIYQQRPPAARSTGTPPGEFASGRAMQQLQVIAARPHAIGSPAEADVRDYIVSELNKLGLSPEVQDTTVAVGTRSGGASAAHVRNIIGRLKGQDAASKALMLTAHYDSVPNGHGASDDGSGVVVLLETMRALKTGPPLQNDVICLFDDGEEAGMMGARAFVNEHPAVKDVGLVLNFEARGASGPVFMFETSDRNGWLVNEFAKAAPYPFSSSLMYSIYKLLPNDTDLTIFKKAGLSGLNFAYIDSSVRYHSQRDNLQAVDERSIQHDGTYALALARHFGNLNLDKRQEADAVYFDIWGTTLINYSSRWVMPLTVLGILLFLITAFVGLRKRQLTIKGILLGVPVFILSMIASMLVVWLLWGLMTTLHSDFTPLSNANLFFISFVTLALAVASTIYLALDRWINFNNLSISVLLVWLILAVLLSVYLPGASYLLLWPLVFSLLALLVNYLYRRETSSTGPLFAVLCVCAVPGIIMMTETIQNLFQGLNLGMLPLLIGLSVLLLGLLIPHLGFIARPSKWLLPMVALAVSLLFLVVANGVPAYSDDIPRNNTVFYSFDADTGEAVWVSPNRRPDEWSSQFFMPSFERRALPNHFPLNNRPFLVSKAPAVNLAADELKVLESKASDDVRTVHVHVDSPRQARVLNLFLEPETKVLAATINGKRVDYKDAPVDNGQPARWDLSFNGVPPEGIDLILEAKSPGPIKARVISLSDGLPEIPGASFKARPANLMPSSNSDVTRVSKSFILDGGEKH